MSADASGAETLPAGLEAYRPNVGICVLDRQGRVWLGARSGLGEHAEHARHRWQMPQGGIDQGEDVHAAALRELEEETSIRSVRLLTITPGWLAYDFPDAYRRKKWRGQRQRWAVMLFEGEDSEIDLDTDEPEFDDWRWASVAEAVSVVVPFKRRVYEALAGSIEPLAAYVAAREGVSS